MSRRRELRFTKIKFDGQRMRLEYQVTRPRGGEPDEFVYVCSDKPLPSFSVALQALDVDVCHICEFPSSERVKMSVRGVSLGWTDDNMGACVTALRALMTSDAPLILNTPYLPTKPRVSDPSGFRLPVATVRRLQALIAEANRYLDGERSRAERAPRVKRR